MHILYIALGGSIGAVTRYFVSKGIHSQVSTMFPAGTLFINATGSFLIGFFFFLFENTILPENLRSFLLIGFLGAYTTFSTYSLETVNMLKDGEFRAGLLNVLASNILCLAMTVSGMILSRVLFKLIR